jgi:tight adherence protein C
MIIVLVAALLSLAAAAVIAGRVVLAPTRARKQLIESVRRGKLGTPQVQTPGFRARVLDPLLPTLAALALRLGRKTSIEDVRSRLQAAGLSRRISPTGFLAGKLLLVVGGLVSGALVGGLQGSGTRALLLGLAFAFGALVMPDFLLARRMKTRLERADSELPKVIDLLAVSVEAGLGFDAALAKLLDRFHGILSEELGVMLAEMRVGESRSGALRRLAERVPSPAVGMFAHALIQGDQLGISLTKILRSQAEEIRNRQRAAAEERAMKAPIKMLFPTVVFILPALFVVALGPPILTLRGHHF